VAFNSDVAKVWRSTNYALSKVVEILGFAVEQVVLLLAACEAFPGDFLSVAVKSGCVLASIVIKGVANAVLFAAKLVRLNMHYQLIQVACNKCIIHAHHHRSVCT